MNDTTLAVFAVITNWLAVLGLWLVALPFPVNRWLLERAILATLIASTLTIVLFVFPQIDRESARTGGRVILFVFAIFPVYWVLLAITGRNPQPPDEGAGQ